MTTGSSRYADRYKLLRAVYEAVNGDRAQQIELETLREKLDWDGDYARLVMDWLNGEDLVEIRAFGPRIGVTHQGIRILEKLEDDQSTPVPPFPSFEEMFPGAFWGATRDPLYDGSGNPVRRDYSGDAPDDDSMGAEEPRPVTNTASFAVDTLLQKRVAVARTLNPEVPSPDDWLGFRPYAAAVAAFLLSPSTQPPLTISIEGSWGQGKSSFMDQLKDRVMTQSDAPVVCIKFNPWKHAEDEQLWASFAIEFTRQAAKQLRIPNRCTARLRLFWKRLWRKESRSGRIARVALLVSYGFFIVSSVWALVRVSPDWTAALAEMAGPATSIISKVVSIGGYPAIIAVAVLLVAVTWEGVRQLLTVDPRSFIGSPNYRGMIPFVERFHEDFRLILECYARKRKTLVFLDDVDRCEPPRAASLMRAINLMMPRSIPIFFILGIDRPKVAASIAATYRDILPYLPHDELVQPDESARSESRQEVSGLAFGWGYVEKFVHLAVSVPVPSTDELRGYIRSLAGDVESSGSMAATHGASRNQPQTPRPDGSQVVAPDGDPQVFEDLQIIEDSKDSVDIQNATIMMVEVLQRNPRRIKQYLNTLRLRAYIGRAIGLFDVGEGGNRWMIPQLGKLIGLEMLAPRLFGRIDQDPGILLKLEKCATEMEKENEPAASAESNFLKKNPFVRTLLRLGHCDDGWAKQFPGWNPSFEGLDIDLALKTAPRIREFPEFASEGREETDHPSRVSSESEHETESGTESNVSDEGRGEDAVRIERREEPSALDSDSASSRSDKVADGINHFTVISSRGERVVVEEIQPPMPTDTTDWVIAAVVSSTGARLEQLVGSYPDRGRAEEVYYEFEAWWQEQQASSEDIPPFRFPAS